MDACVRHSASLCYIPKFQMEMSIVDLVATLILTHGHDNYLCLFSMGNFPSYIPSKTSSPLPYLLRYPVSRHSSHSITFPTCAPPETPLKSFFSFCQHLLQCQLLPKTAPTDPAPHRKSAPAEPPAAACTAFSNSSRASCQSGTTS